MQWTLEADAQKYQACLASLESHVAVLDQKLEGVKDEVGSAGKKALVTTGIVRPEVV